MSKKSDFTRVDPHTDLPSMEREILDLWDSIGAFETQVEMRPAEKEYIFYDGPPFANGSPHYGHILAGVIKDVVPRFWAMKGYRVERRFGWDTHGLPIEMEVERQLGISGPKQIADFGIGPFNEACRALVENTADEWATLVRRMGRWVDMDDDYKTMDTDFMESVWWVFKQLWDKGLVYDDYKVLPYSWGATTPLSNFEANLDYRDTDDPSITVSLEVVEGKGPVETGDQLLIWTTTPWTLPGNLAIAIGLDLEYVRIDDANGRFWLAAGRVANYWKDAPAPAATATGRDIMGVSYRPPFDFFESERERGAFRVIESDTVTTEEGTGLVHMAPAYGEADFAAIQGAGLTVMVDPIDAEGNFTDEVPPVARVNIKEADQTLIGLLKEQGILVRNERIRHSYPFCYRTGTPLIYKVIPTWFIKVADHTKRLVETNNEVHWVPEHVGSRRFGNWLEGARDWAVSRNRYWGSCIPVWRCDTCSHDECIGSIDELYERSGVRLADLHSHYVDPVTWACPDCSDGVMTRVPEVLDCWFESGSMPYAQLHYPFENQERFAKAFPAEFIAEGLDQTRGWFYTLHVLSTLLFDAPSYKNCVVNGMILAEDGRKMSKSLKNYPDPSTIFEASGADALRAFLINSPVLRAEPLRFSEDGVRQVVRTVLLPLWNTYSFFTTYAEADGITTADLAAAPPVADRPEMDRWILSVIQSLTADVNEQMEGYYLYNVVPPALGFIDDLTNWYVRRSRRRFWAARTPGAEGDKLAAFATLYEVLTRFSTVLAPVLPFITERIYQTLVADQDSQAPRSVHHCDFPVADESMIDRGLEESMAVVREVVGLGHALRSRHELKVRQPLRSVTILTHDPAVRLAVAAHNDLIADELNVLSVDVASDETGLVELSCKADFKKLGPQLGPRMKEVANAIAALESSDVSRLLDGAQLEVEGLTISAEDVLVQRVARDGVVVETAGPLAVALDTSLDNDLVVLGVAREVISRVQGLRREHDLAVSDRIALTWDSNDPSVAAAFERHGDVIAGETLASAVQRGGAPPAEPADGLDLRLEIAKS